MEVRELTFKGENEPKLYACGTCGRAYSPKAFAGGEELVHAAARKGAEDCCAPKFCGCGEKIEGPWTACQPCRERNMIAKATVIEAADYDGPISADCGGEWGDGYSSEIAAMIEACHDAGEPIPAYCHPCTEHPLRIDPVAILERAVEEMHEDAFDQIVDADGLIAFIEEWNRKQTSVCYHEDRSRVIIIDKVRVQEILERPTGQCRGKAK